jgi:hypothetical protein
MTRYVDPAPTSPAETILLSSFFTGLARRVQRNVRPALALKVATVVAVLHRLSARIPRNSQLLSYGHPEFAETYTRLGFGSVFAMSFLCFLRGNEPYQLNLAQVLCDLVTVDVARIQRCVHQIQLVHMAIVDCTSDTVQLALYGTTAVSVSLISIFPGPEKFPLSKILYF